MHGARTVRARFRQHPLYGLQMRTSKYGFCTMEHQKKTGCFPPYEARFEKEYCFPVCTLCTGYSEIFGKVTLQCKLKCLET